ncbi:hypothetical protein L7F22_022913 [Adiantum nelumboides]|nr:hypothetical protein [Adiantum nelumboides]
MTRWVEAVSVGRITAADVRKFVLDYICSRFGTPLEILFDRDPGFRADLLDALLENLSIKHVHSTPYYPQCNGLVEKTYDVLCKIITKHVRDRPQDWGKHLTAALWAYRTSFKVSTQFTPYHLVYGQEALLPIEVELGSLRVLAKETTSSKEKLELRIIDLQRLELDRETATNYYITQANKKREQFNNKVNEKKLEEGMLVMRLFDNMQMRGDDIVDIAHRKWLMDVGKGNWTSHEDHTMAISSDMVLSNQSMDVLICSVYPDMNRHRGDARYFKDRAILAQRICEVDIVDAKILCAMSGDI